jgi:hypothetical protein
MSETPSEKQDDVTTDPRMDDDATDWSGEGGATPQGPATDEEADEPDGEGA